MKAAELQGVDLALWVARALGYAEAFKWTAPPSMLAPHGYDVVYLRCTDQKPFMPQDDWKDGGPLHDQFNVSIERAGDPGRDDKRPYAYLPNDPLGGFYGETALIAAARAIVASVYGAEVPDA